MVIFVVVPSAGYQFGPEYTARILANESRISLIIDFELDNEFRGRGLSCVWRILKNPNGLLALLDQGITLLGCHKSINPAIHWHNSRRLQLSIIDLRFGINHQYLQSSFS